LFFSRFCLQNRVFSAFSLRHGKRIGNKIVHRTLYASVTPFLAARRQVMAGNIGPRLRACWRDGRNLKTGWLITAGIVALYIGLTQPREQTRGIANSRATGLAAYEKAEPLALWRQQGFMSRAKLRAVSADQDAAPMAAGLVGGVPAPPPASPQVENDRKVVRTSAIDLVVQKPAEAADRIRQLAVSMGGFLVESQIGGGPDATNGSLTIRVPAARFDEARAAIRKLGLRVQSERTQAQDVTKQYVDEEAGLRNLRAVETQYLAILKQARTVKDTLDVSEKLGDVRGQIEQQQAEFEALSKQIETAAISVSLESEAEARVFGMNWRPLYQLKLAAREGLDGLADYSSTMMNAFFLLPTVLLWLATILGVSAVGWRLLRWAGRLAFGAKAPVPQA
jgi:hypothetical protein